MNSQDANDDLGARFIPLKKCPAPTKRYLVTTGDSLESRCCKVIAANLERYPVDVIGVLDEEGWNAVVRERHTGTAPTKGKGGLDGTGRMAPAIKAQFLAKVEEVNPHLSESTVSDKLVWKDCVEYKFTAGGVERPNSLRYPWPELVDHVEKVGSALLGLLTKEEITDLDKGILTHSVSCLKDAPMNISLLQSSGAGKIVKKFIKGCSKQQDIVDALGVNVERPVGLTGKPRHMISPLGELQRLLEDWKEMASQSGTKIAGLKSTCPAPDFDSDDAKAAETCQTWRSLYHTLDLRKVKRLADQGARMRERKRKLDTDRAKIRQVQRAKEKPQHERILKRPIERLKSSASTSSRGNQPNAGNSKIMELKRQSAVISARQAKSTTSLAANQKVTFSNAAAFANAVSTRKRKLQTSVVQLKGGKQMKMPITSFSQNELRTKGFQVLPKKPIP